MNNDIKYELTVEQTLAVLNALIQASKDTLYEDTRQTLQKNIRIVSDTLTQRTCMVTIKDK